GVPCVATAAAWSRARVALQDRDEQGDRSRQAREAIRSPRRSAARGAGARWRIARGSRDCGEGAADGTARRVRAAQGAGTVVHGGIGRARVQRGRGQVARGGSDEESEGGDAMSELDVVVADARERLVRRARREGLETVGYRVVDSPLGPLWVAVGPRGLLNIHYGAEPSPLELRRIVRAYGPGVLPDARRVDDVARELDQYWSGKRRAFDITVDLSPLTPFQRKVLAVTARVPYGQLITYAKVAHNAGNDRAYRAAAGAIGDNPIPIVVPCHRVVASDGTLGGYAGGLDAKRRLLQLERGAVPPGGWPPAHLSRT